MNVRRRLYSDRLEGYSLVELILVISLIGVLSALGIGLYTRSSAFSPLLATQQLASATLLAQQAALAGQPNVLLTIEHPAGSEPSFNAQFDPDGDGPTPPVTIQSFTLPEGDVSISVGNSQPLPEIVEFDGFGRTKDRTNRTFYLSGDSNFTLCLSSLGAVYQGACQ